MSELLLKIINQNNENARELAKLAVSFKGSQNVVSVKSVALQMGADAITGCNHVLRGVYYLATE